METTVICGPAACGKTTNSGHLAAQFAAKSIVDDWNPHLHVIVRGCLHLTTASVEEVKERLPQEWGSRITVKSFDQCRIPMPPMRANQTMFTRPTVRKRGE